MLKTHHELLQDAAIKHQAVTESAESTQRPARSSSKHCLPTVLTLLIPAPGLPGRAEPQGSLKRSNKCWLLAQKPYPAPEVSFTHGSSRSIPLLAFSFTNAARPVRLDLIFFGGFFPIPKYIPPTPVIQKKCGCYLCGFG